MRNEERVDLPITFTMECDVAVVGGGIAGVYAALAASEKGSRVVLVEEHGFVGGQGTAGGVHTFCGETRWVNRPWREMVDRLEQFGAIEPFNPNKDGRLFEPEILKFVLQEMLQERGVIVLLHTRFLTANAINDKVSSIVVSNKSGVGKINCRQVIDSSGDADVVAAAGWAYDKGGLELSKNSDGHVRTGARRLQLPMSVYFALVDTGRTVTPHRPEGVPEWSSDDELPMITVYQHENMIVVKMKVIGHDATNGVSLSEAEQEGRRQLFGVVYHLQTKGYEGKSYESYKLRWVAPHIGVREGRRIRAEYTISVDDVMYGREFSDAVAVGSYHLDYHWPATARRAGTGLTAQCPPYQIPLRAMLPKGVENVLVPGRSMGGVQLAMSSYRVMGTCAQTGFAAGTVAAAAVARDLSLRELNPSDYQGDLQRSGVRFDKEPYRTYLRVRRREEARFRVSSEQWKQLHVGGVQVLPQGIVVVYLTAKRESAFEDQWTVLCVRKSDAEWSEVSQIATVQSDGRPRLSTNSAGELPDALNPEEYDRWCDAGSFHAVGEATRTIQLYITRFAEGRTLTSAFTSEDLGDSWAGKRDEARGNTLQVISTGHGFPVYALVCKEAGLWLIPLSSMTDDEKTKSDGSGAIELSSVSDGPNSPQGIAQGQVRSLNSRQFAAFVWWRPNVFGSMYLIGVEQERPATIGERELRLPYDIEVMSIAPAGNPSIETWESIDDLPLVLLGRQRMGDETELSVWLSSDGGRTWPHKYSVEKELSTRTSGDLRSTPDGVCLALATDQGHLIVHRLSEEHIKREDDMELSPGVTAKSDYAMLEPFLGSSPLSAIKQTDYQEKQA